ncbi:MAG: PEGA domain-containing protein [Phycisphaeraceae bacterium]|nr:PEGA domain-containing protein [Phycisphaeraceae bacterium]
MVKMTNHWGIVVALLASLTFVGCVERTISVTSEPVGALVYLNDEEVGRTPVRVPFQFYGVYDVRLEKQGYAPLWVKQRAKMPWWEAIGPDLVAEMVPNAKSEVAWHFTLEPLPMEDGVNATDVDALLDRARAMGQRTAGIAGPTTRPVEDAGR